MRALAALILLMFVSPAFAGPACPAEDALNHYVTTKLRADKFGDDAGQIRIYYRLLKPYDPSQSTMVLLNGGPGGDSRILNAFDTTSLKKTYNLVAFDHRGLGCTKVLSREGISPNEMGLLGMSRAADDLEAIRKDLLGANGKWFVYGVSYGTFLGQQYITQYPDSVAGAVLDSAFHQSAANDIARKQYVDLFVRSNPKASRLFDQLVALNPDLRWKYLAAIFPFTYSFEGRTQKIEELYQSLVDLPSRDQVDQKLNKLVGTPGPMQGMTRQIICEEIWDLSTDPETDFHLRGITNECKVFSSYRHPMDFTQALTQLPVRVFIFGGKYDPVTPIQAMRKMKDLIPNSLLWEHPVAGHGVFFHNRRCGEDLTDRFMKGETDAQLMAIANGTNCQSIPATVMSTDFYRKYVSPEGLLF